jgi:hypothetical protein
VAVLRYCHQGFLNFNLWRFIGHSIDVHAISASHGTGVLYQSHNRWLAI